MLLKTYVVLYSSFVWWSFSHTFSKNTNHSLIVFSVQLHHKIYFSAQHYHNFNKRHFMRNLSLKLVMLRKNISIVVIAGKRENLINSLKYKNYTKWEYSLTAARFIFYHISLLLPNMKANVHKKTIFLWVVMKLRRGEFSTIKKK